MSKEFWGKSALSTEIRRNNEKIVIPAFSANCGPTEYCLHALPAVDGVAFFGANLDAGLDLHNAITGEAWIKPATGSALVGIFSYGILQAGSSSRYCMYISGGFLYVSLNLTATGQVTLQSASRINANQWVHVAFTYDKASLKLYINGVLDSQAAYTNAILAGVGDYLTLGDNLDFEGAGPFYGYLSEVRIWNIALSAGDMLAKYNTYRSYGVAGIDTGLVGYFKLNENSVARTVTNKVSGKGSSFTATQWEWSTDYPPLIYGASFIAAKFPVAALSGTDNLSLKFPVVPPLECNFGLAVSWTDPVADIFQRRLLWSPDVDLGVLDIALALVPYNGERLPPTFDIEAWNIDGFATCDLTSAKDIKLSLTTTPSTSIDTTNTSLGTLTKDTTLAQNFPLTPFPLVFNTQQIYT